LSILTKICVVFLVVVSLLAAPVFITQATVATNWRYAYDRKAVESKLNEIDAKNTQVALQRAKEELDKALTSARTTQSEKQGRIDQLTADLATWQTKAAEFQNDLTRLTAEVAGLKQEAVTFNKVNETLRTQLATARGELDKRTRELLQVTDLQKQAEAQKENLDKIVRTLRENLASLQDEMEQLRQAGGTAAAAGAEVTPMPSETIVGTILAVEGDAASISVGSAQGIQRGMKLIVYRGDQLVSSLRVEEVDAGQSAGIIVDRQLDPISGDKVTNRLLK